MRARDLDPAYRAFAQACVIRTRARKKGIPFTLDPHFVPVVPEFCPILGIPLRRGAGRGPDDNSPFLDRLEPELGYVPGNVRWISTRAATIKSNATSDEILKVYEDVRSREVLWH